MRKAGRFGKKKREKKVEKSRPFWGVTANYAHVRIACKINISKLDFLEEKFPRQLLCTGRFYRMDLVFSEL